MELPQYPDPVKGIVVQQLSGGRWVTLIEMPVDGENPDPQKVQDAIEGIEELFYKGDKVHLSVAGMHICVRNIEAGGTFRVVATCKLVDHPATI